MCSVTLQQIESVLYNRETARNQVQGARYPSRQSASSEEATALGMSSRIYGAQDPGRAQEPCGLSKY